VLPPSNQPPQIQQAMSSSSALPVGTAPLNNGIIGGVAPPAQPNNQQGNRANIPGNYSLPQATISPSSFDVQSSVVVAPHFDHGLTRPEARNGVPYNAPEINPGQHVVVPKADPYSHPTASNNAAPSLPTHPPNMVQFNSSNNINLSQSSGSSLSQDSNLDLDGINKMKNMNGWIFFFKYFFLNDVLNLEVYTFPLSCSI